MPNATIALVKHALRFQEEGRENGIIVDHHTAFTIWDNNYIDALIDSEVLFTIISYRRLPHMPRANQN